MSESLPNEQETNPFELISMILDAARRRALWFIVPIILGAAASGIVVYTFPRVYTASTHILLDIANQASPLEHGTIRFNNNNNNNNNNSGPANQVQAIEAWMKSDTIVDELLEHLLQGPLPTSEEDRSIVRANLRRSLNFELQNNSILLITLEDPQKEGLAHKLEFVVTRLLDGLMRPNKGLLSGTQLILLYHQDAANAARQNFSEAIQQARQQENDATFSALKEVQTLITESSGLPSLKQASPGTEAAIERGRPVPVVSSTAMARVTKIADDLSLTARQLLMLAELDKARRIAETRLSEVQESYNINDRSYLPIFATPEKLTLMGRPRDPIKGKVGGGKLAALIALFSIMFGFAAAFLQEMLDRRVRIRSEAVRAMGIPVIARVPQISVGSG